MQETMRDKLEPRISIAQLGAGRQRRLIEPSGKPFRQDRLTELRSL